MGPKDGYPEGSVGYERGLGERPLQPPPTPKLTRVIPGYPREFVVDASREWREDVHCASEVAAHWGTPSRKRRRRRAARKVSGWAKGGVPASLGAAAALCLPAPPALGLARHSSLGRRACPCLGWRSRATGQRSLGSPLCAPRRQPGGFPLIPLGSLRRQRWRRRLPSVSGGGRGGIWFNDPRGDSRKDVWLQCSEQPYVVQWVPYCTSALACSPNIG